MIYYNEFYVAMNVCGTPVLEDAAILVGVLTKIRNSEERYYLYRVDAIYAEVMQP